MHQIHRRPNKHGTQVPALVEFNDAAVTTISRFNGGLSPEQVKQALLDGKEVHTNFAVYRLATVDDAATLEPNPQPHHDDEQPKLLLPRNLDREMVQVLAGTARELAERKDRGIAQAAIDADYLAAYARITFGTTGGTYAALLQLAAVAIEQANLIARNVESGGR